MNIAYLREEGLTFDNLSRDKKDVRVNFQKLWGSLMYSCKGALNCPRDYPTLVDGFVNMYEGAIRGDIDYAGFSGGLKSVDTRARLVT